ncbi:MAG: hypothetical protein ACXADL_12725 [Candidatus Thorarchaeota archaeon]|jgi:hypothetical protein
MKRATSRNFVETLKVSVRFTIRHYASIFLATLGVLVIAFLLFSVIVFLISLPWIFSSGPFDDFFGILDILFNDAEGVDIIWIIFTFGTMILLPFLIAIGTIFGMGQEIVESGDTLAEGALVWYKQKFGTLALGGFTQFSIIAIPIGIGYLIAYQHYHPTVPSQSEMAVILFLTYIWIVISGGAISLTYPALIDGLPVHAALKRSFSMAFRHSKSVYSIWFLFASMGLLLFCPVAMQDIFGMEFLAEVLYEIYIISAALILVFIITPIGVLATSRTYLILSAKFDDYSEDIDTLIKEETDNES